MTLSFVYILAGYLYIAVMYRRVNSYLTLTGLTIIAVGISMFLIRYFSLHITQFTLLGADPVGGAWMMSVLTIGMTVGGYFLTGKPKTAWHLPTILLIFPLYLIFGFVQQVLFQWVLFDSISRFVPTGMTILVTALLYVYAHPFTWSKVPLFMCGLVWSAHYAAYHSILMTGLSHAVLGAAYAVLFCREDMLVRRLPFLGFARS